MWVFLNIRFLQGGIVSTSPNSQAGVTIRFIELQKKGVCYVASGLEPMSFWNNFIVLQQKKTINNKWQFLYRILFPVSAVDSIIFSPTLTLILLTWRIWWVPNNASKWQMGFNSVFKGVRIKIGRLLWRSLLSVLMSSSERIFMKFGVGGLYKTLWNMHDFHEKNEPVTGGLYFRAQMIFYPHFPHFLTDLREIRCLRSRNAIEYHEFRENRCSGLDVITLPGRAERHQPVTAPCWPQLYAVLGGSGIKLPDPHSTCRLLGPSRPGSSPQIHRRRWSYRCRTRPTYSRPPLVLRRPAPLHPASYGATAHWALLNNTLYQWNVGMKLFLFDIAYSI